MENLVPLGTGNSRLMKSNIPSNTTLAQLIQMWNNGTFPYDIGLLNSAGISQQGTPLNKDTLLKDATAALFGLGTDAVPDDVLAKISELIGGLETDIATRPQIATGSYVGTGTYGSRNPTTLNFEFRPKLIFIYPSSGYSTYGAGVFIIGKEAQSNYFTWVSSNVGDGEFFISNNGVSWYGDGAAEQLNQSVVTYRYIAIG